jgi:hypothetical protein
MLFTNDGDSYLIRFWRESEHAPWRYMLQCVSTGQRYFFSELQPVFDHLKAATGTADEVDSLMITADLEPSVSSG